MTAQSQSSLYSREILRLATSLPHDDRLDAPQGSASVRAPLCGSEMTAEVRLSPDGTLYEVAIRARACALGQASASIVRANATGLNAAALSDIRAQLALVLTGEAETTDSWPDLALFESARAHPGRHGAILLPYAAVIAAIEAAKTK